LPNVLEKINSKILLKITLLVIVEIILIVSSFGVLAYFQSQQYSLGNSINIAGKNRYLTSNLLLQTEKYLDGTSNASQLKTAVNGFQSNIITGGIISGVNLKPLSSGYFNLWNNVNVNWSTSSGFTFINLMKTTGPTFSSIRVENFTFSSISTSFVISNNSTLSYIPMHLD